MRTAEDIVKSIIGDYVVQIATLQATVERLKDEISTLNGMLIAGCRKTEPIPPEDEFTA